MPILEKAYAKLHYNYARLNGGWGAESLRALTGMPTRTFETWRMSHDELGAALHDANSKQYAMTAGCHRAINGLTSGHLYTVVDASVEDGEYVVIMRNPWGSERYNGLHSDETDDGLFKMPIGAFKRAFTTYTVAYVDAYHTELYDQEVDDTQAAHQWEYYLKNPAA